MLRSVPIFLPPIWLSRPFYLKWFLGVFTVTLVMLLLLANSMRGGRATPALGKVLSLPTRQTPECGVPLPEAGILRPPGGGEFSATTLVC